MAIKTIWKCDGCDDEKDMTRGERTDWHCLNVTATGFEGYPTGGVDGLDDERFELCPACTKTYATSINPKRWPRAEKYSVVEGE